MPAEECATKRIPVCPKTWEIVHQLRKPGQTFDDVIRELVESAAEKRLVEETRRIVRRGRFVPLPARTRSSSTTHFSPVEGSC